MAELTRRYTVMPHATQAPFDLRDPDAPFVLKPWKDPAALRALEAYRDHCYPELARELDEWIAQITAGPSTRGGVGIRNEQHLEARTASRRPPARRGTRVSRRPPPAKAKSKAKKPKSLKRKKK